MKTGTWCEIASPRPEFDHVLYEAVSLNGVLHWEVHYFKYLHSYILTFDLSSHVFGMIPLPASTRHWLTTGVTTIQGCFALISYIRDVDDTCIRVWRDASWSVVFKLGTGQLPIDGALQPNNGDLLLDIYSKGLHVFNPKTQVPPRVININVSSREMHFHQCIETLHLLDIGDTACEKNPL